MVLPIIRYANDQVAAFQIGAEVYFIRYRNGIYEIYDAVLNQQIIPNIDYWIQNKTQQRSSLHHLIDMCSSYYEGVKATLDIKDIDKIIDDVIYKTIQAINKKGFLYEYSNVYWVEILNSQQIEDILEKIRDNHDKLKPDDFGLKELLNRILLVCRYRDDHLTDICKLLMNKLGINEASYEPDTKETDKEVATQVKNQLQHLKKFKSINENMILAAEHLKTVKPVAKTL